MQREQTAGAKSLRQERAEGATVAEESNKEERVQVKSGVQTMEENMAEILFKVKGESQRKL